MDDAQKQLTDKLKTANNVLVTVSRNPSVDQLASCIGLTLLLNKQGKHAAAVFSGEVPSTLEFLQPEETIEKNTDSLRDFIIALDKSKADKLRYKVEDNVVRIFITPYKTSISQDDLEFSEGDFNVDLVIALGVHRQEDLDDAITTHGRILHDATVTSINITPDAGLGSINWFDPQASSLSELVTELAQSFSGDQLDQQIATALLTGIVSETERFSNDKTSSQTMSLSAVLMAAGANQQLVASKLEEEQVVSLSGPLATGDEPAAEQDGAGTLRIEHAEEGDEPSEPLAADFAENDTDKDQPPKEPSKYADRGLLATTDSPESALLSDEGSGELASGETSSGVSAGPKLMTEPPTMGGTLTANSREEGLDPTSDPLSFPDTDEPGLLGRKTEIAALPPAPQADQPPPGPPLGSPGPLPGPPATASPFVPAPALPATETSSPPPAIVPDPAVPLPDQPAPPGSQITPGNVPTPPPPTPAPPDGGRSLSDLEESIGSPHAAAEDLDSARDEVSRALAGAADGTTADEPIQGLSAQPLGGPLHDDNPAPSQPVPPQSNPAPAAGASAPPPVPPPIPFQFGSPAPPQNPPQ